MLVLRRKKNEQIMIGDNIEVIVVGILGNEVKIGITAPKEVPVHRREVYEAIKRGESMMRERKGRFKKSEEGKKSEFKEFREYSTFENIYHIYSDSQQINYNKFPLNYLS